MVLRHMNRNSAIAALYVAVGLVIQKERRLAVQFARGRRWRDATRPAGVREASVRVMPAKRNSAFYAHVLPPAA